MTVTPMHTGDEGGSNSHCRTAPTTTSLRALDGGVNFGARSTKTLATLPVRSINTVPTHRPCPTIPGGRDSSDGRTYRVRFGALWVRSTRTASTLYRVRASDWQAVEAIAPTRPASFRPPPCASERAGGDNASNAMPAAAIVRALSADPMIDLIIGRPVTAAEGIPNPEASHASSRTIAPVVCLHLLPSSAKSFGRDQLVIAPRNQDERDHQKHRQADHQRHQPQRPILEARQSTFPKSVYRSDISLRFQATKGSHPEATSPRREPVSTRTLMRVVRAARTSRVQRNRFRIDNP